MDPVLPNTRLTSGGHQEASREVQCRAELLRQAWANISANKGADEIRSDLRALAEKFPNEGAEALKSFNYLAALVADLKRDPSPAWLRTTLKDKTPEYLSVQVFPTSIVVHISDETFGQINPGTRGVTLWSRDYPDDLRSRIILVPHPPQQRHETTLRHEIIHTLEAWEPANPFSCVYALKAIAEAKSKE